MITATIGKAVFTLRKDYQSGDLCEPLDVVALGGSLWACRTQTRETPTADSDCWMHLLDGGTARTINTTHPITGGRSLADDLTIALDDAGAEEGDTLVFRKGKWIIAPPYEICSNFYYLRHPTLKKGMAPAYGGLLQDAVVNYPEAWEYLSSEQGQLLCVTEEEWQAKSTATWHTRADGTKIGWNGIGGVPYYALNEKTGDLRLPDLRGMYTEAAGYDTLDPGGVHGDALPKLVGQISDLYGVAQHYTSGPFSAVSPRAAAIRGTNLADAAWNVDFDVSRIVPVAAKNQPRAWGALACVYLGS